MLKLSIISICIIVFIACTSQLYIPDKGIKYINTSYEELKKGRELYVSKCSSCHQLYLPKEYSNEEWQKNIEEMKDRAKASNEESTLIYNYIIHGK